MVLAFLLWRRGVRYKQEDEAYSQRFPEVIEPIKETKTQTEVVCVLVTDTRQEWKSLTTGRRYDVVRENGLPYAKEGDKGVIIMTERGWRVRSLELN